MQTPPAPTAEIELADGISATMRTARALIEGRRQVDLAGLDRMVGLLCARVLDLPSAEGRELRPRLASLLVELDALNGALAPPP